MHAKHNRPRRQQSAIKAQVAHQDAISFFNLLTAPELFDAIESLLPPHRERLFPPTETLALFLAQAMHPDRSCQRAVNEAATTRLISGLKPCSTHTGGYCRARQRLPLDLISELVRVTGALMDQQIPKAWRWQGRSVHIIDGTTVTLPDTSANQAKYPQQRSQKPGLGFPICRIVGVTCLASGVLLNAAMGPYKGKGGSEHTLLRSLLPSIQSGNILLGDALYGSYVTLAECLTRGIDVVFEQNGGRKRSTDFRRGTRLGSKDHLITLKKPVQRPAWMSKEQYQSLAHEIVIRELRVGDKTLITTLCDPATASRQALKSLYHSRWQVELDIRSIKTTLGMETLSCKTPEMAEKEMWVYLLAYNLIRIIMAQSAKLANVLPRCLSFKHTLQLWLAWSRQPAPTYEEPYLMELFRLVSAQRRGNRPGRIEPRAVKRRPKPFSLLTCPRREAQALIRKNGHPPKRREWHRTAQCDSKQSRAA